MYEHVSHQTVHIMAAFPQASGVATVARWKVTSPPTSLPLFVSDSLPLCWAFDVRRRRGRNMPPHPSTLRHLSPFLCCLPHLFISAPFPLFLLITDIPYVIFCAALCRLLISFISLFFVPVSRIMLKRVDFKGATWKTSDLIQAVKFCMCWLGNESMSHLTNSLSSQPVSGVLSGTLWHLIQSRTVSFNCAGRHAEPSPRYTGRSSICVSPPCGISIHYATACSTNPILTGKVFLLHYLQPHVLAYPKKNFLQHCSLLYSAVCVQIWRDIKETKQTERLNGLMSHL